MKRMKIIAVIAGAGLLLGSCMTSNNVVNNNLISKRKYTKGFFINGKGSFKSDKQEGVNEEPMAAIHPKELDNSLVKSSGFGTRELATINSSSAAGEVKGLSSKNNEVNTVAFPAKTTERRSQPKNTVAEVKIGDWKVSELKQALKERKNGTSPSPIDSTAMLIILIILAIIIPPLAVGIYEGITTRFWIDLILALIGWGLGFWLLGHLGFLCGIAAIIYALLIVCEVI